MGKQKDVINMMNCSIDNDSFTVNINDVETWYTGDLTNRMGGSIINTSLSEWNNNNLSCWNWWQNYYYPYIIKESYPVYIKEKSKDKGKMSYELIKKLRDKKLIKVEKVSDFVKLMDELIKLL